MHPRQQLRAAAIAALTTSLGASAKKVVGLRTYAWDARDLPAVEVTAPAESVSRLTDDGILRREVSLLVIVTAASHDGIEDELDAIAEKIETGLYTMTDSAPWGGAIMSIETDMDPGDGGATRPAQMRVIAQVVVHADEASPSTLS